MSGTADPDRQRGAGHIAVVRVGLKHGNRLNEQGTGQSAHSAIRAAPANGPGKQYRHVDKTPTASRQISDLNDGADVYPAVSATNAGAAASPSAISRSVSIRQVPPTSTSLGRNRAL